MGTREMSLEIVLHFFARNPPSILFLGAILMFIFNKSDIGYTLLVVGIFLQVLWLVFKMRGLGD
jgi:hypothetical protein